MKLRKHPITLKSEKVVLRPMTESDWDILLKWNSDADVLYYAEGDDVQAYSLEDIQGMYRGVSQAAFCFIAEVDVASMFKQPDLLILKLMQKLSDSDPLIRRNAAGALRLQGSRAVAAIPALSALLADQDVRVRNEAERAIDHLRLVAA